MNENTRNMLLAAAVSMIFIGLWDYFYAFPEMDRQKKVIAEQERLAKITPLGAPDKSASEAVKRVLQSREAALAQSPRVAIDTKSIAGSIALKGARIDDVFDTVWVTVLANNYTESDAAADLPNTDAEGFAVGDEVMLVRPNGE